MLGKKVAIKIINREKLSESVLIKVSSLVEANKSSNYVDVTNHVSKDSSVLISFNFCVP